MRFNATTEKVGRAELLEINGESRYRKSSTKKENKTETAATLDPTESKWVETSRVNNEQESATQLQKWAASSASTSKTTGMGWYSITSNNSTHIKVSSKTADLTASG